MQNSDLKNTDNNRVFPRVDTTCPVMHRASEAERWSVGLLINFSATGMLFQSARALHVDSDINVRLERGRNKVIPALSGSGKVIRCTKIANSKYEVACKLNHIDPPETTK
ncbi:MAG: PilZ domain-containing protein [Sulfuriflexus sp.]|nr:PilZ domain-containing protein [Sulfuriflexus sp.]